MVNLIQKYRPKGIWATDLSEQLWCEKRLEFNLEKGEKETKEMSIGRERDRELLEEIAILMKVEPKTMADHIAARLHNTQVRLRRLINIGITRNLPITGKINSLFVVGEADELNIENNRLLIIERKTRKKNVMPLEAQKRTNRFQLMLYYKLISDLVSGKFSSAELLSFYGITVSDQISDDFEKQFNNLGKSIETNIKKLADDTFTLFKTLPNPEKIMKIRYEFQQNKKLIGIDEFFFEPHSFQKDCNFVEEFWLEKRKATPVGVDDAWKCNFCNDELYNICEEKPMSKIKGFAK